MKPSIFDINERIVDKALKDPVFRDLVNKDPKCAVEQVLSEVVGKPVKLPATTTVQVHHHSLASMHIVMPHQNLPSKQLSDADLETLGVVLSPTYIKCE